MRLVVASGVLLLAGCLDVMPLGEGEIYDFKVVERASILPTFPGSPDEVYPVVLAHAHMDYPDYPNGGRKRVVCLAPNHASDEIGPHTLLMPESESSDEAAKPAPSMVSCFDRVDVGRGAAQVERPDFDEAESVVYHGSAYCYDRVSYLEGAALELELGGRTFRIEPEADGGFLIDGERPLNPGRALRYEYRLSTDGAGKDGDPLVTVLIDHPGTWLRSRAGPNPLIGEENIPPPPPSPEPPVTVLLSRDAATLGEFLAPLLERPGWKDAPYHNLTLTLMKGELFDVSVRAAGRYADAFETTDGAVGVKIAEFQPEQVGPSHNRTLGAVTEAFADLPLADLLERAGFDAPLVTSHIESGLGYSYAWTDELVPRLQAGETCSGPSCLWVRGQEPVAGHGWHRVHDAERTDDAEALTWVLQAFEGPVTRAAFHPADA